MTVEGGREVEQTVLERIETHDAVQTALFLHVWAIADDDFGFVVVAVHHAPQPLVVDGHAIAVGEHNEVILRRFDAHRERELLAVEEVKVLFQLHRFYPWLFTFEVFQVFFGLVIRAVVHHNEFKIRIVLLK